MTISISRKAEGGEEKGGGVDEGTNAGTIVILHGERTGHGGYGQGCFNQERHARCGSRGRWDRRCQPREKWGGAGVQQLFRKPGRKVTRHAREVLVCDLRNHGCDHEENSGELYELYVHVRGSRV